MSMNTIINQVSVITILLIVGFVLERIKLIDDKLNKGISELVLMVTLPSLIITSMSSYDYSEEMLKNAKLIFIYGICAYVFFILVAELLSRVFKAKEPQRGIYKYMTIFANVGFMGYPIIQVVYGEIGVFYTAIFNIIFNVLVWTLGVRLVDSKNKTKQKFSFKSLINPGTIAIAIGFTMFLTNTKLPGPMFEAFKKIGSVTTPMSMMMVGGMLGESNLRSVFGNSKIYVVALTRLLIIPTCIWFGLSMFEMPDLIRGIITVISAMPTAANCAIFARRYDSDYTLASQAVFVTTLLSIFTIPVIIYMISM